jgi:hypothetical protein
MTGSHTKPAAHSTDVTQATLWPILRSQTGLVAGHCALPVHSTQRPSGTSHTERSADLRQFSLVVHSLQILRAPSHTKPDSGQGSSESKQLSTHRPVCTLQLWRCGQSLDERHSTQTPSVVSQRRRGAEQLVSPEHATHVPLET